jgi:hypothetical protein
MLAMLLGGLRHGAARTFVIRGGLHGGGTQTLLGVFGLVFGGLFVVHPISATGKFVERSETLPMPVFAAGLGVVFAVALFFTSSDHQPCIYFQF